MTSTTWVHRGSSARSFASPEATVSPPTSCRVSPVPLDRRAGSSQRRLKGASSLHALSDATSGLTTAAVADILQRSGTFVSSTAITSNVLHAVHDALQGPLHAAGSLMSDVHHSLHAFNYGFDHIDSAASSAHAIEPAMLSHAALPHVADMQHSSLLGDSVLPQLAMDAAGSGAQGGETLLALGSAVANLHPELHALTSWATGKLAVAQMFDPEAAGSLRHSLGHVIGALSTALDAQAGEQVQVLTNALVLGVHQLVTAVRTQTEGSGGSIQAMLAAQEAMQAAMAVKGPAALGSVGLGGLVQAGMLIVAMIVASVPRGDAGSNGSSSSSGVPDSVPLRYEPEELTRYFSRRPIEVLRRNAVIVSKFSVLLAQLLVDWQTGCWESSMPQRAIEVRVIMEDLGPAYVKIAQVLSTRVDLFPEAYLAEFRKLQDNVPTFSTVEARVVLEDGLAQSVDQVFEWLSEEPIAAASLGQVYRGKLTSEHGGAEVAVKVQRPGVLEGVALDVFIMRRATVLFSYLPGMSDQWAQVLDDWALRFFMEMDYQLEAHNTMVFKRNLSAMQGITVATVYPEITSRKVIVTEWLEGRKLTECNVVDVRSMCSSLLNCYLVQLLETGIMHADPHPGNLMQSSDGKIVILDFGLVTEVSEDQRIALVEYIAHLSVGDWDAISRDLISLGFLPANVAEEAHAVIAPVMKQVMSVVLQSSSIPGTPVAVNIPALVLQLQQCATRFKLVIPPYFSLILRAFSVIEGIALRVDPDYNLVKECMPYMSRRLLTDNNPRMRYALKQLLYGDKKRLDVDRLRKMIGSFSSFTTAAIPSSVQVPRPVYDESGAPVASTSGSSALDLLSGSPEYSTALAAAARRAAAAESGPVVNEAVKEALKVVFSKNGSYAQELIVDELVAATDAMSREALSEGLRMVFSSATTVATLRSIEALGPLRALLMPLPLPMEMLSTHEPTMSLTSEDRQALSTIRSLLDMVQPSLSRLPGAARSGTMALRAVGELIPMVPDLMPGVQVTVEMFLRQLVRRMALRLAEDLEPGKIIGLKKSSFIQPRTA